MCYCRYNSSRRKYVLEHKVQNREQIQDFILSLLLIDLCIRKNARFPVYLMTASKMLVPPQMTCPSVLLTC